MNSREKKYAARYLEAWHKYGNNLPDKEYDRLSEVRRKLGIRLARAEEINKEIVAETHGGNTVPLRKTQLMKADNVALPFQISTLRNGQQDLLNEKPYDQILNHVAQYEATIDQILEDVGNVSQKMEAIKRQLISFSGSLIKEGIRIMRKKHHSGKSKTGFIVSATGATLGMAAYVFHSYRRRLIEQKRTEQLDELLVKKRQIANIRLKTVKRLRDSFRQTIVPRIATLYDKEFHEEVSIDDPLRDRKAEAFRREFVLAVKTRYLRAILDYVTAEMEAWLQNRQESDMTRPDINVIIDEELMSWPEKLSMASSDGSDWDDMLSEYMRQPRKSYPYPIYLILTDPYMLRTYVGLNIQTATNATEPLIQLEYKEDERTIRQTAGSENPPLGEKGPGPVSIPVQHILEQNPYYQDCMRMLEDSHVPKPRGVSWADGLIVAGYIGILLLVAWLIWQTYGLVFTLLTVVYCIAVPFTILPVTENLPYIRQKIRYEEMVKNIKRREENIAKKYRSFGSNA